MPVIRFLTTIALVSLMALAITACGSAAPESYSGEEGARSHPSESARAQPQTRTESAPAPASAPAQSQGSAEPVGPTGASVPSQAQTNAGPSGPKGAGGPMALSSPTATAAPQSAMAESQPQQTATAAPAMMVPEFSPPKRAQPADTTFQDYQRSLTVSTQDDRVSTFSLDTDRTSYQLALSWARSGYEVDPDSVRAEEWINAFNYGYRHPSRQDSFAVTTDVFRHPLDGDKHLARLAFQAPEMWDQGRPLNVTLVLDASGSMKEGNCVAIAREAAESIRSSLRDRDRIAVVHFTDNVIRNLTVEHQEPDDRAVKRSISKLEPHGSTNVQAGLNLGVELADEARRERPEAFNYIILMSDGVANVDATDPFAILETADDRSRKNPLRLITIGVGIKNYNDYLLEQLAQHGNGWYRYLDNTDQARTTFSRENWLALAVPFADQARAQVTWDPDVVQSWRLIGYENRIAPDHQFAQNRKEFAEIPSGAATTVFYELELADSVALRGWDDVQLGGVELRWVTPGDAQSMQQHAAIQGRSDSNFVDLDDSLLRLGALVALSSDRYSSLPYVNDPNAPSVHRQLSALVDHLQPLESDLGKLEAYQDFSFLLEHITRYTPREERTPGNSGYSR